MREIYDDLTPAERIVDKIEIFFRAAEAGPAAGSLREQGQKYLQRAVETTKVFLSKRKPSERLPGFWEVTENENDVYSLYSPIDADIRTPLGLPVVFMCDLKNPEVDWIRSSREYDAYAAARSGPIPVLHGLPLCAFNITWEDGHSAYVRFYRKHALDAVRIYQRVVHLHDSLVARK